MNCEKSSISDNTLVALIFFFMYEKFKNFNQKFLVCFLLLIFIEKIFKIVMTFAIHACTFV